jgi:hypothetical protein
LGDGLVDEVADDLRELIGCICHGDHPLAA